MDKALNERLSNLELSVKTLEESIVDLTEVIGNFKSRSIVATKKLRPMTEADAENIIFGELKDTSNRECAEKLGLSYGQIYSARRGYTFRNIYMSKEAKKDVSQIAN